MGQVIEIAAPDGNRLSAYEALPEGRPRGGVVILHEIFGLTPHIRDVADVYADNGYHVLAPALFDRLERGVIVPYASVDRGRALVARLSQQDVIADTGAAVMQLAGSGRVGVVGYCWGGTVAWMAAAHLPIAAAVAYYGGRIHEHLDLVPRCPVMFHYGEQDPHIPRAAVERVQAAFPGGEYHWYAAGHGFNCTDRSGYDPDCARLALGRTLGFLAVHVG